MDDYLDRARKWAFGYGFGWRLIIDDVSRVSHLSSLLNLEPPLTLTIIFPIVSSLRPVDHAYTSVRPPGSGGDDLDSRLFVATGAPSTKSIVPVQISEDPGVIPRPHWSAPCSRAEYKESYGDLHLASHHTPVAIRPSSITWVEARLSHSSDRKSVGRTRRGSSGFRPMITTGMTFDLCRCIRCRLSTLVSVRRSCGTSPEEGRQGFSHSNNGIRNGFRYGSLAGEAIFS